MLYLVESTAYPVYDIPWRVELKPIPIDSGDFVEIRTAKNPMVYFEYFSRHMAAHRAMIGLDADAYRAVSSTIASNVSRKVAHFGSEGRRLLAPLSARTLAVEEEMGRSQGRACGEERRKGAGGVAALEPHGLAIIVR